MLRRTVGNLLLLSLAALPLAAQKAPLRLRRVAEARENAFTILIPAGWQLEGGVLRINPFQTNGPTNTVGAKFDFRVKDAAGAAEMHWLPGMTYQDPRRMTLPRPVGSQYQGMLPATAPKPAT